MGFIPVFLCLAAFFFLWGAIIFYTFRNYRVEAELAAQRRRTDPALATLPTAELVHQGKAGLVPADVWQAELAFRTARHRYNKLLAEAPYSVFGRWFGYRPIA